MDNFVGVVLVVFLAACGAPDVTAPALQRAALPPVALTAGGASNTQLAMAGLAALPQSPVRPTPGQALDSLWGGSLARYLGEDNTAEKATDRWMDAVRSFPAGNAYWFQIAIRILPVPAVESTEVRRAVQVADSILKYRAEAVIVFSGLGVDNGNCVRGDFAMSERVADSLVARGYGRRGPSVTLLPSDFQADRCHPNGTGQVKWGKALRGFPWLP
jgi:hypothetical protein